jgi:ABC-type uncharacterized transport system permease subunit
MIIFRLFLYPGIIVHEFMHLIMCLFLGVKVNGIKFGINESYVKHQDASTYKIVLIALAPFILGNILAILLIALSIIHFYNEIIIFILINWINFAIIFYSIPSKQDLKNIKESLNSKVKSLWNSNLFDKFLLLPYLILIYLPITIIMALIYFLDKYEAVRLVFIILIYIAVLSYI